MKRRRRRRKNIMPEVTASGRQKEMEKRKRWKRIWIKEIVEAR